MPRFAVAVAGLLASAALSAAGETVGATDRAALRGDVVVEISDETSEANSTLDDEATYSFLVVETSDETNETNGTLDDEAMYGDVVVETSDETNETNATLQDEAMRLLQDDGGVDSETSEDTIETSDDTKEEAFDDEEGRRLFQDDGEVVIETSGEIAEDDSWFVGGAFEIATARPQELCRSGGAVVKMAIESAFQGHIDIVQLRCTVTSSGSVILDYAAMILSAFADVLQASHQMASQQLAESLSEALLSAGSRATVSAVSITPPRVQDSGELPAEQSQVMSGAPRGGSLPALAVSLLSGALAVVTQRL